MSLLESDVARATHAAELNDPDVIDAPASHDPTHYSYSRYLQEALGGRTYKVTVSSGLSCPTRDGTISTGGCAFCDVRGSSSFHGKRLRGKSVTDQINGRASAVRERFKADKLMAYFQSYTNTYADPEELRPMYVEALSHPEIAGLAIGTRPDCIPDPIIDLLEELAQSHYVSLELGIQSFENATLEWLDRGHDAACSIEALERIRARAPHVQTCAHFMFGSPTDSPTAARDAAQLLNQLGVRGAKLHQLMVLENTDLAKRYRADPFKTLTLEEYCAVVLDFVEHLSPDIYIERLSAQSSHAKELVAPVWSSDRWLMHNTIRDYLERRGCRQGSKLARLTNSAANPAATDSANS